MNKNNDPDLTEKIIAIQKLVGGLDKAMREDRDMIRYLSFIEQAAREAGWAALAHYAKNMPKLEVV